MSSATLVRPLRYLLAVMVVIGLLGPSYAVFPADAQIHLEPWYIDRFEPQSREVTVSKTASGTATYQTTVSVSKPPAVGVVYLNLTANCSQGYPVEVVPSYFAFKSPGDIKVSVTLTVPAQSPPVAKGVVTLKGELSYSSEEGITTLTRTESGFFTVQSYNAVNVTVGPEVMVGAFRTFEVTVRNDGNVNDSFSVSVTDPLGVLNITQDKFRTMRIGPNMTDMVIVKVWCPLDVLRYDHRKDGWNISIVIKSDSLSYDDWSSNRPFTASTKAHFDTVPGDDFRAKNAAFTLVGTLILIAIVRLAQPYRRRV